MKLKHHPIQLDIAGHPYNSLTSLLTHLFFNVCNKSWKKLQFSCVPNIYENYLKTSKWYIIRIHGQYIFILVRKSIAIEVETNGLNWVKRNILSKNTVSVFWKKKWPIFFSSFNLFPFLPSAATNNSQNTFNKVTSQTIIFRSSLRHSHLLVFF